MKNLRVYSLLLNKWRKTRQGWKIFIAGCVFGLFILAITLSWPHIEDKIWGKHPDTYVYIVGQEYAYTINELKEINPIRTKIRLVPIKFPEGMPLLRNADIPLRFFDWSYSEDTKLYTIEAHNRGDGIDRNVKIDIDFTPNLIDSLEISHENRVSLIQGGKPTSSRAVFKIDELLPNERQDIEILLKGKEIKSISAWSEKQGEIEKIFILDVVFEP